MKVIRLVNFIFSQNQVRVPHLFLGQFLSGYHALPNQLVEFFAAKGPYWQI